MTEGSAKAMGDETRIGQLIPGKGIYLGIWSPKDREGVSLSKTFNVFAAPYDLGLDENGQGKKRLFKSKRDEKLIAPYDYTVGTVAAMKNLMGHKGADYKNDTELYDALRSGAYKGEWFIPPRDLVDGKDVDGNKVQNDNLYSIARRASLPTPLRGPLTATGAAARTGRARSVASASPTSAWSTSGTAATFGFLTSTATGCGRPPRGWSARNCGHDRCL